MNQASKLENNRRMTYDPPAGERRAMDRRRLSMTRVGPFNGVRRRHPQSFRSVDSASVVNPENLAPCCDHRLLTHRSVVAVRWSQSLPKRARQFTAPIRAKPRPYSPVRNEDSVVGRLLVQNELYHTEIAQTCFFRAR